MFGSCSYLLFDWRMSLFGSLILLYFLNELFGWLWRSWTPKSNGIQGGKQWIRFVLKILLIDRHDANMKDMKRNYWNGDSPKTHYQKLQQETEKEVEHAKKANVYEFRLRAQKNPKHHQDNTVANSDIPGSITFTTPTSISSVLKSP